jgi:hypothetical protein
MLPHVISLRMNQCGYFTEYWYENFVHQLISTQLVMDERTILGQLQVSIFQANVRNIWSAWKWYFKFFVTEGIIRIEIQLQT